MNRHWHWSSQDEPTLPLESAFLAPSSDPPDTKRPTGARASRYRAYGVIGYLHFPGSYTTVYRAPMACHCWLLLMCGRHAPASRPNPKKVNHDSPKWDFNWGAPGAKVKRNETKGGLVFFFFSQTF